MPTPMPQEICLEDLDLPEEDERYLRCVALPGGEPGLALDGAGQVRWMPDGPECYELCISADDRLVLLRNPGSGPLWVERAGRSLEAPVGQPVLLRHQDLLRVDGRRLRVHVHGQTEVVYEPEPLSGSALARMARAAATALALGAAVGAGGVAAARPPSSDAPIEVRARPPVVAPSRLVTCSVTAIKPLKKGKGMVVHATCPAKERIGKGSRGYLVDTKTKKVIKGGQVVVTRANKGKVEGTASALKSKVKAAKLHFRVYH